MRAAVLLLALAGVAVADEPTRFDLKASDIPFGKVWYGVYVHDKKAGHASRKIERGTNDTIVVRRIIRIGQWYGMDEAVFGAAAPFPYRGGIGRIGDYRTIRGRRDRDRLELDVDGQMARIPFPDFTLPDLLGPDTWVRSPRAPGDAATFRAFDLLAARSSQLTMRVRSRDDEKLFISFRDSIAGGRGTMRVFPNGVGLSRLAGNFAELRREPEDVAKRKPRHRSALIVRHRKWFGRRGAARRVVLEIKGGSAEALRSGPWQEVKPLRDGLVRVALGPRGAAVRATREDVESNLRATDSFPAHDTAIRAMARAAVGDAEEPAEKVRRLVVFVHDFMRYELWPGTMPVDKIVAEASGDCSEYSRLFATLARAAGIPTRTVTGYVFTWWRRSDPLGGHAWNEVVLDGAWVPVDATLRETELGGTHLRLGAGPATLLQLTWALAIERIEVVEVEKTK